jgi:hypothetical protein
MTLNGLGLLYHSNNAHTKAQSAYEEALEIRRTTVKQTKTVECHCYLR